MYLYFNENGILKEIINDSALRKGNVDSNVVYAHFEGNPQISTISFTFTRNGSTEPIILGQDLHSPILVNEDNPECFVPYEPNNVRKLKYFKYFTPYKFYKCTLNGEVLAVSGLLKMTILAINGYGEQVAQGMFVGMVEDNNLEPTTEITYGQYQFLLSELGRKVGFEILNEYQEKLIAGDHVSINDNVISIYDVEGLIAYIDLTDSENEITQEQLNLLNLDKLNYILLDGVRYNYAGENKYVSIDKEKISQITIDAENLTWEESEFSLSSVEYQEFNISNDIQWGITTEVPQSTRAKLIITDHQLIISIRVFGTAYSVPSDLILDDYALPSEVASKIQSLYNTNHLAYGTSIVNFGGEYYQDIVELRWSSDISRENISLLYLSSHETSLESKNITLEIRIVLDF